MYREVRNALRTLPATLDATYSDALERVFSQAPDAVDLASSVLFWIVCARRPLTVAELQHIYTTRDLPSGTDLEDDDLPDSDILTGVCGGLIAVESALQTVHIVHYTAQQYFERSRKQELLDARRNLTIACLTYLTLPNFSSGLCQDDTSMAQRLQQYPFLDYAAKFWGTEVSDFERLDDDFLPGLQQFAKSPTATAVTSQVWSVSPAHHNNWSQEFPRGVPALVLAAAFPLPNVLRHMVSNGHEIDGKGSDGETALIRAAVFGHSENVRTLLTLGADVNARDYMGETALHRAARAGAADIIKTLIDWKATLDLKTSSDWTGLMSAVSSGSIEAVRILVHAGVDMAAETVWGDSALSIATRSGQEEIATFLADKGAILLRGPAGRRASLIASRRGYQQLVRRLTVDYEAVAGQPLQRQASRIMGDLHGIRETAEPARETTAGQVVEEDSIPEADESDISDLMARMGCLVGFPNRYDICDTIGEGHFAQVHLCVNKVTGVRYAVKAFKVKSWKQTLHNLEEEVKAMRQIGELKHPNILRLIDFFAEYTSAIGYIVLELAADGELFSWIVMHKKLTEEETRKVFVQLFSAINSLVSALGTIATCRETDVWNSAPARMAPSRYQAREYSTGGQGPHGQNCRFWVGCAAQPGLESRYPRPTQLLNHLVWNAEL